MRTGFSSTIFSTYRPQSTTPDVATSESHNLESLQKKRHRYRTKFAELIQSKYCVKPLFIK